MDYVCFPSLKFIHWTVKILCVPTVGIIVPSSKQTDYEMTINFGDMQISAVYPESTGRGAVFKKHLIAAFESNVV